MQLCAKKKHISNFYFLNFFRLITNRYENHLIPAMQKGIKRGLWTAMGASITNSSIYAGYALAFWYGVQLIIEDYGKKDPEYNGGTLIIVKYFKIIKLSLLLNKKFT